MTSAAHAALRAVDTANGILAREPVGVLLPRIAFRLLPVPVNDNDDPCGVGPIQRGIAIAVLLTMPLWYAIVIGARYALGG